MAFADQPAMSKERMWGLGVVALLHIGLGYAFVTGLALKAVKVMVAPIEAVEIADDKKPEEPPPPPPKMDELPPFVPPPMVSVEAPPPPAAIVVPPSPPRTVITQAAPPNPPPAGPTTAATPKGKLGATITTDDYPEASIRAEEEGVTKVQYEVNEAGRVTPGSCRVTASSTHDRLDRRTCELVERRFRFNPALMNGTPVKVNRAQAVRWQIPKN